MAQYLTDLPEERIAKYRLMAVAARKAAYNCKPAEAVEMYMAVASAWDIRAAELEHDEQGIPHLLSRGSRTIRKAMSRP
jgi:hypothetical protein